MTASLDERGREVLDQTPVEAPIKFTRPEPIHIHLRRLVEQYHQQMRDADEYETFDDADDFDVEDGAPSYESAPTEYEANFMPRGELLKKMFPEKKNAGKKQAPPADDPAEPPQAAPGA